MADPKEEAHEFGWSTTPRERARALWELGTERLLEGDVPAAVRFFEESIEESPTAEGYTYRGWAISFLGRLEEAIADCKKAIQLDPEFGNPYNDIGVYLMQLNRLDEAIPWLESAKQAERYEPRHYPYLNLGRIYAIKGDAMRALDEFTKALEIEPGNPVALAALQRLNYSVN